ncbi:hypothetical protein CQW23_34713 [Capsicum baccatum]|uniref:Uncharacterized protein n=1 Tax=Capsicum baccatum TaxID=33114 RepID=A0A2G2UY78_CAPBA|nr:hypothetical protein CQW23_34713 [Capsicum baccatum]
MTSIPNHEAQNTLIYLTVICPYQEESPSSCKTDLPLVSSFPSPNIHQSYCYCLQKTKNYGATDVGIEIGDSGGMNVGIKNRNGGGMDIGNKAGDGDGMDVGNEGSDGGGMNFGNKGRDSGGTIVEYEGGNGGGTDFGNEDHDRGGADVGNEGGNDDCMEVDNEIVVPLITREDDRRIEDMAHKQVLLNPINSGNNETGRIFVGVPDGGIISHSGQEYLGGDNVFENRSVVRVKYSQPGTFLHRPYQPPSLSAVVNINNAVGEYLEREKRTPKKNSYYKKSEFLLEKDILPS